MARRVGVVTCVRVCARVHMRRPYSNTPVRSCVRPWSNTSRPRVYACLTVHLRLSILQQSRCWASAPTSSP
eukprot:6181483-Pleurochrysis_carterae.AAC.3